MSGKAEGKKHNRAAQSQQHGFKEAPDVEANKPTRGKGQAGAREPGEREKILEKLRRLEEERRAAQEAAAPAEEEGGAEE